MTNPWVFQNLILQICFNHLNTHTLQIIVPFATNRSQIILHNVHAQARVLPCGGGGVWNSDSAGLQEGPGKIMELEKSQLNWVYCYLDSGLICVPLSRSHLKHFQRCRVKTAKRFRSRFASLRPEWSWWRRPRRCATRRSRWPLAANQCNITVIILIITIITIKVEVTTLQSSATSLSSFPSLSSRSRWPLAATHCNITIIILIITIKVTTPQTTTTGAPVTKAAKKPGEKSSSSSFKKDHCQRTAIPLFRLFFSLPPPFKEVPLTKILVRQQLPSPAAWGKQRCGREERLKRDLFQVLPIMTIFFEGRKGRKKNEKKPGSWRRQGQGKKSRKGKGRRGQKQN